MMFNNFNIFSLCFLNNGCVIFHIFNSNDKLNYVTKIFDNNNKLFNKKIIKINSIKVFNKYKKINFLIEIIA